jgi:hypothetical protein
MAAGHSLAFGDEFGGGSAADVARDECHATDELGSLDDEFGLGR